MDRPLYIAEERRFDGPALRLALIRRRFSVERFASQTGLNRTTLYAAIAGRRVSDQTVGRILGELDRHDPIKVA